MHVHVFAYGSNLCTARLKARVPSAEPIAVGHVTHRQLVFHKRSEDGSAKADARWTGVEHHRVWGVVFRIADVEKPILDECEFLGIGYDETEVEVVHESGILRSWLYQAREEAIDDSLLPYDWYHDFVVSGAREHRLPTDYLARLKSHAVIPDPDEERSRQNRAVIESLID
ncbi:MAG: gamma-glutamylcyclotransferase [Planctomycetaceae bacterium]|nr:gamma-glutamylcyclotransferase [Planctomycetaceae bacterium]